MCRPTQSNPQDVYALTSTFSSQAELSYRDRIQPHPWPCIMGILHLPLQTGWSMFTEYVLLVTLHLQSHTCSASTRGLASPLAVPTQQRLMAGVAAMCMRSKLGSGCLGAASSAWVVSLWRRLLWRKALCAWNKPSVQQRLVGAGATSKWSVCVVDVYTCMYQYVPVRTDLYLHYLNFAFLKIDAILSYLLHRSCTLLYLTLRALPGCMRYLRVLSQVCTSMYQYVLIKKCCTDMYWYVQVRTGTYPCIRFCPILSRCTGFQMFSTLLLKKYLALLRNYLDYLGFT